MPWPKGRARVIPSGPKVVKTEGEWLIVVLSDGLELKVRATPPVEPTGKGFLENAEDMVEELGLNPPVIEESEPEEEEFSEDEEADLRPSSASSAIVVGPKSTLRKRTMLTSVKNPKVVKYFNSALEAANFLGVRQAQISTGVRNARVERNGYYVADAPMTGKADSSRHKKKQPALKQSQFGTASASKSAAAPGARSKAASGGEAARGKAFKLRLPQHTGQHFRARAVRLTNAFDPTDTVELNSHKAAAAALLVPMQDVTLARNTGEPCRGWYIALAHDPDNPKKTTTSPAASTKPHTKSKSVSKRSHPQDVDVSKSPKKARKKVEVPSEPPAPAEPAEPAKPSKFDVYAKIARKATDGKWPVQPGAMDDLQLSAEIQKFQHTLAGGRHLAAVFQGHSSALSEREEQEMDEMNLPRALTWAAPGHSGRLYLGPQNRKGRNRDFLVTRRPTETKRPGGPPVPALRQLDAGTWYDVTAMEKDHYLALDVDSEDGYHYVAKILGLIDASRAGKKGFLAYIVWPAFPEFDPVWLPYHKDYLVQWAALESEGFELVPPEDDLPKIGYAYVRRKPAKPSSQNDAGPAPSSNVG
eukprot:m.219976 g.219976  ORF g.219976 m.219976 type:complete len:587 (-) comp15589_c0_seq2:13150-14910(-)